MLINLDRIKSNLLNVGEIGKNSQGGITRLAFSKEYFDAVNALKTLFNEQGLSVEVDRIGNVIGKRDGKHDLPSIMIGSHLDTVKNGGLYDGALGVIAALECVCVLNDNEIITNHPIEIIAFNAEEGSEMGGTFGSRVIMGKENLSEPNLQTKLNNYNLTIDDLKKSVRDSENIKAFLELHIEQGGYLENNNISIGVVNGITGIIRYSISIKGEANHAGTTPMDIRKDALTMASKLILKIHEISKDIGRPFVSTIGQLTVKPGDVNVIPGEVNLVLEMRDMNKENIDKAINEIKKYTNSIQDYKFEYQFLIDKPNVETDKTITEIIRQICINSNIKHEVIPSGAGHDAKEIAAKIPIGMIFVPSKDGKSHCPEEFTEWKDIDTGVQVLFDTLIEVDNLE